MNSLLSDVLDRGLEREFKTWANAAIATEVSLSFDKKYEFSVETNEVLFNAIRSVLSTYVMQLDLEVSGKEALMAALDTRVAAVLESGALKLPMHCIEDALNTWFAKIKKDINKEFFGPSKYTIEITEPPKAKGAPIEVNETSFEIAHAQLPGLVHRVAANVPVWYYGAPGSGKNHLAYQCSQALKLDFYPVYLGPTTTESKLLGYKNAGAGIYVEGLLYKPFMVGGLIFLDEIDVTDPAVLVSINALISNDEYRFPDGNLVRKHKDVRFLAAANTLGLGGLDGFKRNSQDAAARDRWIKFKAEYDEAMERKIAIRNCPKDGEKWARYVQGVRKFVTTESTSRIHVTPRASYNGASMLQAGIHPAEVCEATIFAEMEADTKAAAVRKVGTFKSRAKE